MSAYQARAGRESSGGKLMKKILLIDRSNECREAWAAFLEKQGCCVIPATSGNEALSCWREHKSFDAIVMDLYTPEGNGMAVMETLSEWTAAPVIAVAEHRSGGFDLLPAATILGAARGLRKPLSAERIWEEIVQLTGGDQRLGGQSFVPRETDSALHASIPVAV